MIALPYYALLPVVSYASKEPIYYVSPSLSSNIRNKTTSKYPSTDIADVFPANICLVAFRDLIPGKGPKDPSIEYTSGFIYYSWE